MPALLVLLALLVSGCFNPQLPADVSCAGDGICPAGLRCDSDQICRAPGAQALDAGDGAGDGGGDGDGDGGGDGDAGITSCVDMDLGTALGTTTGTTNGAGDEWRSCFGQGSPDVAFSFTAPSSGLFSFDTCGSNFDTVLSLYSSCFGQPLECNDDFDPCDLSSLVDRSMNAGETVIVVVDGLGEQGSFDLTVGIAD